MKTITLGQVRRNWRIYVLIVPVLVLVGTFSYFPAVSATYHSFVRWDGDAVSQYVKLGNFRRALSDPVLAKAFGTVMILIAANLVKMIPSIITAVLIHRLISVRARYLYRVAFVIPMIIPGMARAIQTMIGLSELGRIWRAMIRLSDAPTQRAASTNSFSFKVSTELRTNLATPTQETKARATKRRNKPLNIRPRGVSRRVTMRMTYKSKLGNA